MGDGWWIGDRDQLPAVSAQWVTIGERQPVSEPTGGSPWVRSATVRRGTVPFSLRENRDRPPAIPRFLTCRRVGGGRPWANT